MIKTILGDIIKAGYEYRMQAFVSGCIGYMAYGIWELANACLNRRRAHKKWYLCGRVLYRSLLFACLCMYFTYVISLTLSGREAGSRVGYVNAGLFETFFVDGAVRAEALENLLLLMPLGVLIPMFFCQARTWKRTGLFALLFSFGIESVQLMTGRGYFQADDILLNLLGALWGYFFWSVFHFRGQCTGVIR